MKRIITIIYYAWCDLSKNTYGFINMVWMVPSLYMIGYSVFSPESSDSVTLFEVFGSLSSVAISLFIIVASNEMGFQFGKRRSFTRWIHSLSQDVDRDFQEELKRKQAEVERQEREIQELMRDLDKRRV